MDLVTGVGGRTMTIGVTISGAAGEGVEGVGAGRVGGVDAGTEAEARAVAATKDEVAATGPAIAALAISIIGFRKVGCTLKTHSRSFNFSGGIAKSGQKLFAASEVDKWQIRR